MIIADKLAYSSKIRDKSPFMKTIFSVGTLVLCVISRSIIFSAIVMTIMGYSTLNKSRVSLVEYLRFMLIPGTFLLLSSVTVIFDFSKTSFELINIHLGSWFLGTTRENILYGMELMLTAMSSVSCLYFLSVTTPIQDLILVLRKCKMPWLMIEIAVLMYRFIFIIGDMTSKTIMAQNCRLGNVGIKNKIRDMGLMLSTVFIRSYHRASKLFEAMEARCYDGQIKVLWEYNKATKKDIIILCGYLLVAMILAYLCR